MNEMEKECGVKEINKPFNKNGSAKLRIECLANYGINIKKEYVEEVTKILFDMVNNSFLKSIKDLKIEDMFNDNSSKIFRLYLEHFSLESTTFSEAHFIVDYFEGFCLNINKKQEISRIFLVKNKEKIKNVLKAFLQDKESLKVIKANLLTKYLQFIFVTQINSGFISLNQKTYMKFTDNSYSDYLVTLDQNNNPGQDEEMLKRVPIPVLLPNLIGNFNTSFSLLLGFMRKSNGFTDYISSYGSVRNSLTTRELKFMIPEMGFLKIGLEARVIAYRDLLKKAFNTKGVMFLTANKDNFKDSIKNAVLYYEQTVYNLNERELEELKTRLEV